MPVFKLKSQNKNSPREFKTLFLKWYKSGDIWISKDPVDTTIRLFLHEEKENQFYGGIVNEDEILEEKLVGGRSVFITAWKMVAMRIDKCAELLDKEANPAIIDVERISAQTALVEATEILT